jgi:hypothetical protein
VRRAGVWLTPLLLAFGALPGGRWILPLVLPLAIYPRFSQLVKEGDTIGAWKLGLLWAGLLSAGVIGWVALNPFLAANGILHGEPYREEMFGWITTGVAPENDWRQFLPIHLLHLGVFLALSGISAGYFGLVLGAVLVDYMSFFVGSFAMASRWPALGAVVAWVPWSVVRVLSFVLLGVLCARPLLLRQWWPFRAVERRLFFIAASGIVADLLIKWLCAPGYGRFLATLLVR